MNPQSVGGQAFEALYRQHHDTVFRACMRFAGGDRDWAIDRAHDVFVILARRVGDLANVDDLGGWLYRVALNTCLTDLRKARGWRKVKDVLTGRVFIGASTPELHAQAKRDVSKPELVVRDLPVKQRALMTLVHLDGKTRAEAAKLLAFSERQVSKLCKMALAALEAREWESARERLDKERLTGREAAALQTRIAATVAGNRQGLRIAVLASGPIAAAGLILIIALRPSAGHETRGCMREHAGFIDIDPACSEPVAIGRGSDVITAHAGTHLEETSRGVRVRYGEAAFTVHKRSKGDSMRVLVSHGDIEITGTRFTVRQRDDEGEVRLDEGGILFHWADGQEQRVAAGETLAWPRRVAKEPVTLQPIALQPPEPQVAPTPAGMAPPPPVAKAPPAKASPAKAPKAPPTKAPAVEPDSDAETQTPETAAAAPMSIEEVLKQMALLRSEHRYRDAVELLRGQLGRQDFSDVQRARLSYEMGMLMQDRLDDAAASCAHWRDHLRKFTDDAVHADRVQEYLQKCQQQ